MLAVCAVDASARYRSRSRSYSVQDSASGTSRTWTHEMTRGVAPAGDALDEVNAARARRGLRPYLRDEGLTQAAHSAATYRASRRIFGHVPGGMGDFQFLPPGSVARAAGCGALDASWGWGSCCTYDSYTYAGAAVVIGADGRRFMHLFVR